jgi:hypothetical protein
MISVTAVFERLISGTTAAAGVVRKNLRDVIRVTPFVG